MKIVYEDGELDRISRAYNEHEGLRTFFDESNPERVYSICFKVTNFALATYVLLGILNNHLEEIDLGIDVLSINFGDLANKDEVKARLHRMIEEVLG